MKRKLNLLGRYLASECTDDERRKVEQWVRASEKNKRTFNDLQAIWKLCGAKLRGWDSKRAFTALRLKLKDADAPSGGHDGGRPKLYRIIPYRKHAMVHQLRIMAQVAAVLFVLGGTFYATCYMRQMASEVKISKPKSAQNAFEEISTKPGQQATVKFSDGTKVILNSDSKLKYSDDLFGSFEFYLDGEAYFEVVHTNSRPVIVRTLHAAIRDLGTKFDVKSWDGDEQTKVVVTEGEVFVRPNGHDEKKVVVLQGQCSIIKEDGTIIPPSYASIKRNIAWLDGKLIFYNEPMRSVTKQLHRKYGLECFVSDPSILSRTLTATFDNHLSPQQVLNVIALSLNITCRTWKDSVLFVPGNPSKEWKNKSNQKED